MTYVAPTGHQSWDEGLPLTVPDANRSPVRSEAPFTVRCASICAGDQYIAEYGGRDTTSPLSSTSKSMS